MSVGERDYEGEVVKMHGWLRDGVNRMLRSSFNLGETNYVGTVDVSDPMKYSVFLSLLDDLVRSVDVKGLKTLSVSGQKYSYDGVWHVVLGVSPKRFSNAYVYLHTNMRGTSPAYTNKVLEFTLEGKDSGDIYLGSSSISLVLGSTIGVDYSLDGAGTVYYADAPHTNLVKLPTATTDRVPYIEFMLSLITYAVGCYDIIHFYAPYRPTYLLIDNKNTFSTPTTAPTILSAPGNAIIKTTCIDKQVWGMFLDKNHGAFTKIKNNTPLLTLALNT